MAVCRWRVRFVHGAWSAGALWEVIRMPPISLGIDLNPVIQWAAWVWGEIDVAVYLLIGTSFGFIVAKYLKSLFV